MINLVSKITFILFFPFLFLIEGLIQLSIKIFEEHGNEMKCLEGILFIEEEFTYLSLSIHLLFAASC